MIRARQPVARRILASVTRAIPETVRGTAYLRAFGLFKIPLLFFISPSVVELTEERCVIRVPFARRNRNHLGSMYFGVLAAAADCAGGLGAMRLIQERGGKLSLIFKDFHARFLKRVEGDALFTCEYGQAVRELVERAEESGEREEAAVDVVATVPSKLGAEPVATFRLTLSLKRVEKG